MALLRDAHTLEGRVSARDVATAHQADLATQGAARRGGGQQPEMTPKRGRKRSTVTTLRDSPRRVFVHIGLPKTGTMFLQASLEDNRTALEKAGLLYPSVQDGMFLAALDVRGTYDGWGRRASETRGAWERLCQRTRAFDGDTLISHELFAAAPIERVESALDRLADSEVHVVVTTRDLARQAVAEWQESVKHGRRLSFTTFTSKVLASDADGAHAQRFRASQDLIGVLQRWSGSVPPERLHIVTCPPVGASPGVLWQRFADAVRIDTRHFGHRDEGLNRSLGRYEVDLLRRVNRALDGRIAQPSYSQVVKELFAEQVLAVDPSPRPTLPADLYPEMTHAGERWIKEIDAAGYTVHGDLDDLLPRPPAGDLAHPDQVDHSAELTHRRTRLRGPAGGVHPARGRQRTSATQAPPSASQA